MDNSLNLFFGQKPNDDFLEDLSSFSKLKENEISKLINKVIEWYTKEDIDREWEEWTKSLPKEEIEEKKSAIRIILFIFKEFASENINETELKEDFETLKLPQKYFDYFIKPLKSVKKEFREKTLKDKKPNENFLASIDWRIDKKTYRDGMEKNVAIIEFIYSDKGEKKVAQFDLNLKALKHLISKLKQIEEELCKIKH